MERNPRCFKCGKDYSRFLVWTMSTAEGNLVLLYCDECGTVQGVVRKEG